MKQKCFSFIAGFIVLFIIYHAAEFYPVFWFAAVTKIGFLLIALFIARLQGFTDFSAYGLPLHKGFVANLLKGLLIGIFFFMLSAYAAAAAGFERLTIDINTIFKQLPKVLLMTAFPSVAEDILTRGYLYAHLHSSMSRNQWIIWSAVVYVLNHIWRLQDGLTVLSYLMILRIALAYALYRTHSLWLAFGIHWCRKHCF